MTFKSRTKVVSMDKLGLDPEFAFVLLRLMMVMNDCAAANPACGPPSRIPNATEYADPLSSRDVHECRLQP
jgi:hypothetical protein